MEAIQNRTDSRNVGQATTAAAWLTLKEAATRAVTSDATLRREIARGRLRHARIGGRKVIRLKPEWVDQWLEGTGPKAA